MTTSEWSQEWSSYTGLTYVVHIRALKQVLNHGLILQEVHTVIQFNQETWLKEYIDMNTKLKTSKKWFWERFFQIND